jgi:hypothetical protein
MRQDEELVTAEAPLTCALSGAEQGTRKEEVDDLLKHVQEVQELADGYALRFPGSDAWADTLLQFIRFERRCCPFFHFGLLFEPQQGPLWLHLRGQEGVKAIIAEMLNVQRGG